MRIIAGQKKGIKLENIKDSKVRPTLDRVKENLFNIIESNINFYNKNIMFLDLFGGFGGIGIEASSRGANSIIFEIDKKNFNLIKKNISKAKLEEKILVYNISYEKGLKKLFERNTKVDCIYIDPPYFFTIGKYIEILENILRSNILKDATLLVIESEKDINIELKKYFSYEFEEENDEKNKEENKNIKSRFKIIDIRQYGRISLAFMQKEGR